jgi:SAM-dependent methyltransferase
MARAVHDAEPPDASVSREHFDGLYSSSEDPWQLASAWYERRKYGLTIAALPRERYRSALEPGCSIGQLTRLLAGRCDRLFAFDFAAAAIERARDSVQDLSHVRVEQRSLPGELPDGRFDLIVVSEVLYYLSSADLTETLDGLLQRLEPDGDLVAVHHRAADRCYGYDGFNVHGALASRPELEQIATYDDDNFALRVLRRIRWS